MQNIDWVCVSVVKERKMSIKRSSQQIQIRQELKPFELKQLNY